MSEDGDQQFRENFASLIIGKGLFNETNWNRITCDKNYAEILCSRSSAYVERLTAITRNPFWPQVVKDDFCSSIIKLQQIPRAEYEKRWNGLDREDTGVLKKVQEGVVHIL